MEITVQSIRFQGDQAAAAEVMRLIGQTLGIAITPAERTPSEPLASERAPAQAPRKVTKGVTRLKQAERESIAIPKRQAPRVEPNAEEAIDVSPLAQKIVDFILLHGAQQIPQLAVALRTTGGAIGRSVASTATLRKGSDGLVYVVD